MTLTLSNAQAKRIALAAQGFADPRPTGRVDRRHLRRVLDRIGLIQIDSVNVLVRSQELPLFARLGPHPRTLIDDATRDGELFEYWVHEASLVPTDQYHLYRWRMREPYPWPGFRRRVQRQGDYIEQVYQRVVDEARWSRAISRHGSARRAPGGTTTTARPRSRRCSTWVASPLAGDRTTSPASTTSGNG